ncbi:MAG: insulinase family protein [Alphaproteobacteria bacterium]|nr:insulinase family protein [Alphaproteobacteria bacterium]
MPVRTLLLTVAASAALTGCPKSAPPAAMPEAAAVLPEGVPRTRPEPLPAPTFEMPTAQKATLSNGLPVLLVANHEVPLFDVRIVFRVGPDADPAGKEGLGDVMFGMMNEGAAGRDAAGLARELEKLGGGIGSGAGTDAASVSVSGPTKNLSALLDLWTDVVRKPDFPDASWEVLQASRVQRIEASRKDPGSMALRAQRKVVYGDAYTGRLDTVAATQAITPADMRAFHARAVRPDNAVILVGGDVDLDTVLPLLEARLGKWKANRMAPLPGSAATPTAFAKEVVYLVDKPGAAQTVLRAVLPVGTPTDADWRTFGLANTAFGGAFTARVNMNLREDKGWTYGARCGTATTPGPALWVCSANIQADQSVPAMLELRRELRDVVGDRPITEQELTFFRGYRINAFYGSYETPGELLGELQDIWVDRLPADWLDTYVPQLEAVTVDSAEASLKQHLDPDRVGWLLVGDKAGMIEALKATGLPIVELDADGAPLSTP